MTIAKIDTLEIRKISKLSQIPEGWIKVDFKNVKKIRIINLRHYEYGIKRWPVNLTIPNDWNSLASLGTIRYNEVADYFGLRHKKTQSELKDKTPKKCWIHNSKTHKNKLISIESRLPSDEWEYGIYLSQEALQKCKDGGQQVKEKYYGHAEKFKCVYDIKLGKRRFIGQNDTCPYSCIELSKDDNSLSNAELDHKYASK